MQYIKENNLGQEYSIYKIDNIFWKHLQLNIYSATVSDRMHYYNLKLFNYQVSFSCMLIKGLCDQEDINEFDNYLVVISCFLELKLFKYRFENIAWFIAAEFRYILK